MFRAVFLFVTIGLAFAVPTLLFHPDSPLPNEWHPLKPLEISDPVTPLTGWKLRAVEKDPELCFNVLAAASDFERLEDRSDGPNCGVSPRLAIRNLGQSQLQSLETTCATALRTALWERHSIQPRAVEFLGSAVSQIKHSGSYSCRMIRTPNGANGNWSTHARAMAIDIRGFATADGQEIDLLTHWSGGDSRAQFLKAVRDGACDWFRLTLSPDFNALHADHFHLQVSGRGSCR